MTQHCVFSGLILKQIKLTKKTACNSSSTTTEDHVFFILGNNVSGILKLCLDLNQRKHYKNYSKWIQKHFKDNGTSGWDETLEFLNIRSQGRNTSLAKWEGGVRPLDRGACGRPATPWAVQPADLSRSHNCLLSSPSVSHAFPTWQVSLWQRPAAFKPQLPLLHGSEVPEWHQHLCPWLK